MFENPEAIFGGTKFLLSLIESIYATVDNTSLWAPVMDSMANAMQCESMVCFAVFPNAKISGILALHEMSEEEWGRFASYYATVNPIMPRAESALNQGLTAFSHEVIPNGELERTEFYADFFNPNLMHYSVGLRLFPEGLPDANFSCQRPKSKGPFGERADIVYQTLNPHLQRAISLTNKLGKLEATRSSLEMALDRFDYAVLGLDARGRVILSNRQAEKIVAANNGLRLSHGSLTGAVSAQNEQLQRILSDAVAAGTGQGISAGASLSLSTRTEGRELWLTAIPFASSLPGRGVQLAALVFVTDTDCRPQSRATAMRALFSLTPIEMHVADLLLEGLEIKEIAARLRLTVEASRFHVKRLLAKTGTNRQKELLKLMLSLPAEYEPALK